jgi:2-oxoglutarate ferredoxin oxidoreductase subunit beta
MKANDLISSAKNTWCPGCGNFVIQHALKDALAGLDADGVPVETVVMVAGIGQHGKTFDFMNLNGFYGLHGRAIPAATGIRLANRELRVFCTMGDGDCYAEGLEHLVFAAKRNVDITVLVHDNRVYGLTTGQFTPTSPHGYRGRSTPGGAWEQPFNPLELVLVAGATFVARGYSGRKEQLSRLIREAILHRGFSLVDILQVCATYFNRTDVYEKRVYDWKEEGPDSREEALQKVREWDYDSDAPIGLGVLYRAEGRPTYEDGIPPVREPDFAAREQFFLKMTGERL